MPSERPTQAGTWQLNARNKLWEEEDLLPLLNQLYKHLRYKPLSRWILAILPSF
jgi:hypothetical protein